MTGLLGELHFLRPLWLLLLLPALLLAVALYRSTGSAANWRNAIAADLIDYLLEAGREGRRHWVWLLALGWLLATLALAGPAWEKSPQPVLQKRDALVIVLDLSLSMYAEDIKPSRLQRARYKILDILKQRREGLTGLVVYSGDAHVVSPLTDDNATIANLVPALAPAMMPSYGSDAAAGIETAIQLLRNAGFERGRILLLSDEIDAANADAIAGKLVPSNWQLSIIGVGTDQGAPIPSEGGFIKSASGAIAIAQLHRERFQQLAQTSGARYSDLQMDDGDISALLAESITSDSTRTVQREFDQWRERGPQLVLLLLPLAALAFRRGWLLALLLLPLSAPSQADTWNDKWKDLWQRPDQQAQQLFSVGDSKDAAQKFTDPAWRGAAQYRAGEYENAAQTLTNLQSADAHYNRGNALAQAGKLQEALIAYEAALQADPALDDAKFNRKLVENLLKQQQQNKQNQQQGQQDDQNSSQPSNAGDGQQHDNGQASGDNNQQRDSTDAKANDSQQAPSAEQGSQTADKQPTDKSEPAAQTSQAEEKNSAKKTDTAGDARREDDSTEKNAEQPTLTKSAADGDKNSTQQLQQRATEQWLRQIPDDPSGLLRRKFLYEHRQRQRESAQRSEQPAW